MPEILRPTPQDFILGLDTSLQAVATYKSLEVKRNSQGSSGLTIRGYVDERQIFGILGFTADEARVIKSDSNRRMVTYLECQRSTEDGVSIVRVEPIYMGTDFFPYFYYTNLDGRLIKTGKRMGKNGGQSWEWSATRGSNLEEHVGGLLSFGQKDKLEHGQATFMSYFFQPGEYGSHAQGGGRSVMAYLVDLNSGAIEMVAHTESDITDTSVTWKKPGVPIEIPGFGKFSAPANFSLVDLVRNMFMPRVMAMMEIRKGDERASVSQKGRYYHDHLGIKSEY